MKMASRARLGWEQANRFLGFWAKLQVGWLNKRSQHRTICCKPPKLFQRSIFVVRHFARSHTCIWDIGACMCLYVCARVWPCTYASVCSDAERYLYTRYYAKVYESYGNLFKILIFSVKSTRHGNVIAHRSSILKPEWGNRLFVLPNEQGVAWNIPESATRYNKLERPESTLELMPKPWRRHTS